MIKQWVSGKNHDFYDREESLYSQGSYPPLSAKTSSISCLLSSSYPSSFASWSSSSFFSIVQWDRSDLIFRVHSILEEKEEEGEEEGRSQEKEEEEEEEEVYKVHSKDYRVVLTKVELLQLQQCKWVWFGPEADIHYYFFLN